MYRRLVCAAVVAVVTFSVATSGEFTGIITKIDGNKITFQKTKKGEKQKGKKFTPPVPDGDPVDLTLPEGVKFYKSKFDPEAKKGVKGDEITEGLKAEMFTAGKFPEEGINATITTKGDELKAADITEIRVGGGGGKGKGKDKAKDDKKTDK